MKTSIPERRILPNLVLAAVTLTAIATVGSDGPRPTILYGYGGFGQTLTPTYSAFALA